MRQAVRTAACAPAGKPAFCCKRRIAGSYSARDRFQNPQDLMFRLYACGER